MIGIIRKTRGKYWGTVRYDIGYDFLCYDTALMETIAEVKKELNSFAKWKGGKITKWRIEKYWWQFCR